MPKKNKPECLTEHLPEILNEHQNFDFEASLNELVQLVEWMEAGGQSLENSLKQFERGIVLIEQCQNKLKNAQQRVHKLIQKDGQETLVEYTQSISNVSDEPEGRE